MQGLPPTPQQSKRIVIAGKREWQENQQGNPAGQETECLGLLQNCLKMAFVDEVRDHMKQRVYERSHADGATMQH